MIALSRKIEVTLIGGPHHGQTRVVYAEEGLVIVPMVAEDAPRLEDGRYNGADARKTIHVSGLTAVYRRSHEDATEAKFERIDADV